MAKHQTIKTAPKVATKQPVQPTPKAITENKPGISLVKKLCILLAIISCVVYYNTLQNGYVLDDVMVIKENHYVKLGIQSIPDLLKTPHLKGYLNLPTDTYRPLSLVMFAIEYQLFGDSPAIGHAVNILLMAGCVIALFLFLYRLLDKKIAVAFMAALLFAVHPIHTEVVANIKSRDELLCFFFAFLSLNVLLQYNKEGKISQLITGLFCLYLSFISKETVITFIGIVPLVFFFYRNENRQRAIHITIGTLVIAGIFLAVREAILNEYHANAPYVVKFLDNFLAGAPSGMSKFATAVLILGHYFKLMVISYPLICDWSYSSIPFANLGSIGFIVSAVLYLGLAGIGVYRLMKFKKDPWAFAILFYLITLSLFSNILFLVGAALADRFAFFASAGICLLIALAIEKWILRKDSADDINILKSTPALAVLLPLTLAFAGFTIDRNSDWKDNYTLYSTDVAKSPDNTRLHYYMGAELQKKYDETNDPAAQQQIIANGLKYLKRSLEIYPYNVDSHAEIGATYFRAKQYDSAVKHLERALQLNPKQTNASTNLGTVYLTQQRYAEALPFYRQTVRVNPGHVLALFNLAVCYVQVQKYDSAVIHFKKTIELDPAYLNHRATEYTSMVYKMAGQMDSARRYEVMAKEFNPNFHN
jgi:tetratricopeptide (TPR) repeat protein